MFVDDSFDHAFVVNCFQICIFAWYYTSGVGGSTNIKRL